MPDTRALQDVEPLTRGDPESPLRWTNKSTHVLAAELTAEGHPISRETVGELLRSIGYSLQGNRKMAEGDDHEDRDAQFRFISDEVRKALAAKRSAISVDTKQKRLLGKYYNAGQQWRRAKTPQRVQVHDSPSPTMPRAYPYGIHDLGRNIGFVNVATDHATGAFAVASIRGWWRAEGRRLYPAARSLWITADGGGSNGYRLRQWKVRLQAQAQALADEAQITIRMCHSRRGPASGTRSSTACSGSSRPIGAGNH